MDLIVQLGKLLSSTWRVRSLEDVLWYIGEQETLDNYTECQGKTEHFWYLEQVSNTSQVLEAKNSEVETPLVDQASRRLVSTYLGYQELVLCFLEWLSQLTD